MIDDQSPIDRAMTQGARPGPDPTLMADTRQVEIPIDHNPDAVIGEGPSAQAAKQAMTSIWTTWCAVKSAADDPATDLAILARVSQQAVERGLKAADTAVESIQQSISAIEQDIDRATRPRITDELAAEIRTYWRHEIVDRKGDRSQDKIGHLMSAAGSDLRTASAVLSAPSYLSGLGDEHTGMVRDAVIKAHCPERQADLEEARRALRKVRSASERVTKTLAPKITLWANPEPTALRKLRSIADGKG